MEAGWLRRGVRDGGPGRAPPRRDQQSAGRGGTVPRARTAERIRCVAGSITDWSPLPSTHTSLPHRHIILFHRFLACAGRSIPRHAVDAWGLGALLRFVYERLEMPLPRDVGQLCDRLQLPAPRDRPVLKSVQQASCFSKPLIECVAPQSPTAAGLINGLLWLITNAPPPARLISWTR